jgi:phosphopantetheine adenylyltransferase
LQDPQSNPLRISYLETVAIRLGLLMILKLRNQRSKTLVVWTDNTTTENGINNKKSRDELANAEWMKIQKILIDEGVELLAKRVLSKDNKADLLSRGIRSGQHVKQQVVIEIPPDLTGILSQVVFLI